MSSYSSDLNAILEIFCSMAEYQQSMVINQLQKTLEQTISQRSTVEPSPTVDPGAEPISPLPQKPDMPKPKPKLRNS